jgi:SprT protein
MRVDFYSFLPEAAKRQCAALVQGHNVTINVVRERRTKHGDFRVQPYKPVTITLNAMENRYRFLLTFLHEWAHYMVFSNFRLRKKPHGDEWKTAFQKVVTPFYTNDIFSNELLAALKDHMQKPRATFSADPHLMHILRQFDPPNDKKCIFELEQEMLFSIDDGRLFRKGAKRRTRFLCTCIKTKKQYLFPPFVEVNPVL